MDSKKKNIVFVTMFAFVAIFVVYAFAAAPPEAQKAECNDHEHEQPAILEGVINQIDQITAKSITVQLDEMENEDCANQIASSLVKLGSVGKIRCDITAKRFEVQYDPKKLNESHILNAFLEAQHPGKIVSNS